MESILIIGGARSGKSRFALDLAEGYPGNEKLFIATCIPRDIEMKERVARHQRERNPLWKTLEIPIQIADAVLEKSPTATLILIDCLTLWVSNLIFEIKDEKAIYEAVRKMVESLSRSSCPVILVSNEVGCGIVPENPLARLFRDISGRVNQQVAGVCSKVFWMTAGIPVPVKH
ncbi:MAG: bifunctional adenosylcobinamide kinase/adenosylcobinamide-phosphate guanylyltransferase [Thermodesulfobacteriota bacterium]